MSGRSGRGGHEDMTNFHYTAAAAGTRFQPIKSFILGLWH
jgi:hypothetical protein